MKKTMIAFGCLLISVGSLALAADPAPKSERIPKELEQLAWMVGDWADQDEKANVQIHCEWVKNKHYLKSEITASLPDGSELEAVEVIGWDPDAGQIRSWVFDSNGGFAAGPWQRANRQWITDMKFVRDDGAKGSATNLFTLVDDQTFKWKCVTRTNSGAALPGIDEVTLHRQTTAKDSATPPQGG